MESMARSSMTPGAGPVTAITEIARSGGAFGSVRQTTVMRSAPRPSQPVALDAHFFAPVMIQSLASSPFARRALARDEGCCEARLLFRIACEQDWKQSEHGAKQSERDVCVHGVELLGEHRHVEAAGALAAEGGGDKAAEEAGRLLVKGPRRREARQRRRQAARSRANLGEHVAREGSCVGLQALLFHC
jgi:hypothetical protein